MNSQYCVAKCRFPGSGRWPLHMAGNILISSCPIKRLRGSDHAKVPDRWYGPISSHVSLCGYCVRTCLAFLLRHWKEICLSKLSLDLHPDKQSLLFTNDELLSPESTNLLQSSISLLMQCIESDDGQANLSLSSGSRG